MFIDRWKKMLYSTRINALLLVGAQALLVAALATMIAGPVIGAGAVLAVALVYFLGADYLPKMLFSIAGARLLTRAQAPHLYEMVEELARRAGLRRLPRLVYLPHRLPNAFTMGGAEGAIIGVSRGLLDTLNQAELAGVLAHEISHVRNGDTRLLGFAAAMAALCQNLSLMGQILLLLNLPLLVSGQTVVPWTMIMLLTSAPVVSLLVQLALSRTREYEADLGAVELTGDPKALASALVRIEAVEHGMARRILWTLWPSRRPDTWLSTHPATSKRVQRLLTLVADRQDSWGLHLPGAPVIRTDSAGF